jgi:integrase
MARRKLTTAEIAKRKREGRYHDGRLPLSAKRVQRLKGEGRYHDALVPGLYLQITASGARSWLLRFEQNGRERMMGLGSAAIFTLAQARERAREARRLLTDGVDPLAARHAAKAAAKVAAEKKLTFREAAHRYFDQHERKWTNASHRDQFLASLKSHAFDHIGAMDVATIGLADVLRCIEPIWIDKSVTADRVRNRIENVLDWCVVRGHRPPGTNPARWKGHLDQVLPAARQVAPKVHHKALPYAALPAFMADLRQRDDEGVAALALQFLIHTAARTGEVIHAKWDEVDFATATWTIPAARMKARVEHRVPLSPAAVDLLRKAPREAGNEHIFIGPQSGLGLGGMVLSRFMKRMGHDETVHGFRASFRTWAAAETNFTREVCERALAHVIGNQSERAYERGDLFNKRRKLMEAWSRFCTAPVQAKAKGDVVVPIGGWR